MKTYYMTREQYIKERDTSSYLSGYHIKVALDMLSGVVIAVAAAAQRRATRPHRWQWSAD